MTSIAVCAEGFWVIKRICSCVRRDLQLCAHSEELKGSAAECVDQNCDFSKELNKTKFCGCNPYTGGEPRYIWCFGSLCYCIYVLVCINN